VKFPLRGVGEEVRPPSRHLVGEPSVEELDQDPEMDSPRIHKPVRLQSAQSSLARARRPSTGVARSRIQGKVRVLRTQRRASSRFGSTGGPLCPCSTLPLIIL
jgi:hypothetical protein